MKNVIYIAYQPGQAGAPEQGDRQSGLIFYVK